MIIPESLEELDRLKQSGLTDAYKLRQKYGTEIDISKITIHPDKMKYFEYVARFQTSIITPLTKYPKINQHTEPLDV